MGFKNLVKKIIFGKRASSEAYIAYLRKIGIKIGTDVTIYVPTKTLIDEQYPWLISIGDHVRITEGVKILTHDYAWSVIKCNINEDMSGAVMGASGKVQIGNNVFIGMNSIITCGVSIGDNTIIGAGSVVTHDCESGYVYAGIPARKIISIDEYFEKRRKCQVREAVELARSYKERFGEMPNKEIFHEYYMLFENQDTVLQNPSFVEKLNLGTGIDSSLRYMDTNTTEFKNFDDFLDFVFSMTEKKDVD